MDCRQASLALTLFFLGAMLLQYMQHVVSEPRKEFHIIIGQTTGLFSHFASVHFKSALVFLDDVYRCFFFFLSLHGRV